MEKVSLISKGYEWECPNCGCLNEEEEDNHNTFKTVICDKCKKEFKSD